MKYGIIGAGSTGKAAAAWLHQAGCPALIWDRDPRKRADLAQSGLLATGKVEGQLPVETADTLEELAARCDILLIQTLAESGGHDHSRTHECRGRRLGLRSHRRSEGAHRSFA